MELLISYADRDKPLAVEVIKYLISNDVDIWVDFIDIQPDQTHDNFVSDAMKNCDAMVFIYTPHSNAEPRIISDFVKAKASGRPVVVYKTTNIMPSFNLAAHMKDSFVVDAFECQNFKQSLDMLFDKLQSI